MTAVNMVFNPAGTWDKAGIHVYVWEHRKIFAGFADLMMAVFLCNLGIKSH